MQGANGCVGLSNCLLESFTHFAILFALDKDGAVHGKSDPQIGMRVTIDYWRTANSFGTIVEVTPYAVRVAIDDFSYQRDSDAHSFSWECLTPVSRDEEMWGVRKTARPFALLNNSDGTARFHE